MSPRDRIVLAMSLLGIAAMAGNTAWRYRERESREGTYRRQLIQLGTQVKPCMSVASAEPLIAAASSGLTVEGGPTTGGWVIMTPLRVGAKNWFLYIDVTNGSVTRIRYRTEDGVNDHPPDAPTDVQC